MVKGRQALEGGANSISVILTDAQLEGLAERRRRKRKELKRGVSRSEIIREAVDFYLTTSDFFKQISG